MSDISGRSRSNKGSRSQAFDQSFDDGKIFQAYSDPSMADNNSSSQSNTSKRRQTGTRRSARNQSADDTIDPQYATYDDQQHDPTSEAIAEAFCFCGNPLGTLIGCDICDAWSHPVCVRILERATDDVDSYVCPKCVKNGHIPSPAQLEIERQFEIDHQQQQQQPPQHMDIQYHPQQHPHHQSQLMMPSHPPHAQPGMVPHNIPNDAMVHPISSQYPNTGGYPISEDGIAHASESSGIHGPPPSHSHPFSETQSVASTGTFLSQNDDEATRITRRSRQRPFQQQLPPHHPQQQVPPSSQGNMDISSHIPSNYHQTMPTNADDMSSYSVATSNPMQHGYPTYPPAPPSRATETASVGIPYSNHPAYPTTATTTGSIPPPITGTATDTAIPIPTSMPQHYPPVIAPNLTTFGVNDSTYFREQQNLHPNQPLTLAYALQDADLDHFRTGDDSDDNLDDCIDVAAHFILDEDIHSSDPNANSILFKHPSIGTANGIGMFPTEIEIPRNDPTIVNHREHMVRTDPNAPPASLGSYSSMKTDPRNNRVYIIDARSSKTQREEHYEQFRRRHFAQLKNQQQSPAYGLHSTDVENTKDSTFLDTYVTHSVCIVDGAYLDIKPAQPLTSTESQNTLPSSVVPPATANTEMDDSDHVNHSQASHDDRSDDQDLTIPSYLYDLAPISSLSDPSRLISYQTINKFADANRHTRETLLKSHHKLSQKQQQHSTSRHTITTPANTTSDTTTRDITVSDTTDISPSPSSDNITTKTLSLQDEQALNLHAFLSEQTKRFRQHAKRFSHLIHHRKQQHEVASNERLKQSEDIMKRYYKIKDLFSTILDPTQGITDYNRFRLVFEQLTSVLQSILTTKDGQVTLIKRSNLLPNHPTATVDTGSHRLDDSSDDSSTTPNDAMSDTTTSSSSLDVVGSDNTTTSSSDDSSLSHTLSTLSSDSTGLANHSEDVTSTTMSFNNFPLVKIGSVLQTLNDIIQEKEQQHLETGIDTLTLLSSSKVSTHLRFLSLLPQLGNFTPTERQQLSIHAQERLMEQLVMEQLLEQHYMVLEQQKQMNAIQNQHDTETRALIEALQGTGLEPHVGVTSAGTQNNDTEQSSVMQTTASEIGKVDTTTTQSTDGNQQDSSSQQSQVTQNAQQEQNASNNGEQESTQQATPLEPPLSNQSLSSPISTTSKDDSQQQSETQESTNGDLNQDSTVESEQSTPADGVVPLFQSTFALTIPQALTKYVSLDTIPSRISSMIDISREVMSSEYVIESVANQQRLERDDMFATHQHDQQRLLQLHEIQKQILRNSFIPATASPDGDIRINQSDIHQNLIFNSSMIPFSNDVLVDIADLLITGLLFDLEKRYNDRRDLLLSSYNHQCRSNDMADSATSVSHHQLRQLLKSSEQNSVLIHHYNDFYNHLRSQITQQYHDVLKVTQGDSTTINPQQNHMDDDKHKQAPRPRIQDMSQFEDILDSLPSNNQRQANIDLNDTHHLTSSGAAPSSTGNNAPIPNGISSTSNNEASPTSPTTTTSKKIESLPERISAFLSEMTPNQKAILKTHEERYLGLQIPMLFQQKIQEKHLAAKKRQRLTEDRHQLVNILTPDELINLEIIAANQALSEYHRQHLQLLQKQRSHDLELWNLQHEAALNDMQSTLQHIPAQNIEFYNNVLECICRIQADKLQVQEQYQHLEQIKLQQQQNGQIQQEQKELRDEQSSNGMNDQTNEADSNAEQQQNNDNSQLIAAEQARIDASAEALEVEFNSIAEDINKLTPEQSHQLGVVRQYIAYEEQRRLVLLPWDIRQVCLEIIQKRQKIELVRRLSLPIPDQLQHELLQLLEQEAQFNQLHPELVEQIRLDLESTLHPSAPATQQSTGVTATNSTEAVVVTQQDESSTGDVTTERSTEAISTPAMQDPGDTSTSLGTQTMSDVTDSTKQETDANIVAPMAKSEASEPSLPSAELAMTVPDSLPTVSADTNPGEDASSHPSSNYTPPPSSSDNQEIIELHTPGAAMAQQQHPTKASDQPSSPHPSIQTIFNDMNLSFLGYSLLDVIDQPFIDSLNPDIKQKMIRARILGRDGIFDLKTRNPLYEGPPSVDISQPLVFPLTHEEYNQAIEEDPNIPQPHPLFREPLWTPEENVILDTTLPDQVRVLSSRIPTIDPWAVSSSAFCRGVMGATIHQQLQIYRDKQKELRRKSERCASHAGSSDGDLSSAPDTPAENEPELSSSIDIDPHAQYIIQPFLSKNIQQELLYKLDSLYSNSFGLKDISFIYNTIVAQSKRKEELVASLSTSYFTTPPHPMLNLPILHSMDPISRNTLYHFGWSPLAREVFNACQATEANEEIATIPAASNPEPATMMDESQEQQISNSHKTEQLAPDGQSPQQNDASNQALSQDPNLPNTPSTATTTPSTQLIKQEAMGSPSTQANPVDVASAALNVLAQNMNATEENQAAVQEAITAVAAAAVTATGGSLATPADSSSMNDPTNESAVAGGTPDESSSTPQVSSSIDDGISSLTSGHKFTKTRAGIVVHAFDASVLKQMKFVDGILDFIPSTYPHLDVISFSNLHDEFCDILCHLPDISNMQYQYNELCHIQLKKYLAERLIVSRNIIQLIKRKMLIIDCLYYAQRYDRLMLPIYVSCFRITPLLTGGKLPRFSKTSDAPESSEQSVITTTPASPGSSSQQSSTSVDNTTDDDRQADIDRINILRFNSYDDQLALVITPERVDRINTHTRSVLSKYSSFLSSKTREKLKLPQSSNLATPPVNPLHDHSLVQLSGSVQSHIPPLSTSSNPLDNASSNTTNKRKRSDTSSVKSEDVMDEITIRAALPPQPLSHTDADDPNQNEVQLHTQPVLSPTQQTILEHKTRSTNGKVYSTYSIPIRRNNNSTTMSTDQADLIRPYRASTSSSTDYSHSTTVISHLPCPYCHASTPMIALPRHILFCSHVDHLFKPSAPISRVLQGDKAMDITFTYPDAKSSLAETNVSGVPTPPPKSAIAEEVAPTSTTSESSDAATTMKNDDQHTSSTTIPVVKREDISLYGQTSTKMSKDEYARKVVHKLSHNTNPPGYLSLNSSDTLVDTNVHIYEPSSLTGGEDPLIHRVYPVTAAEYRRGARRKERTARQLFSLNTLLKHNLLTNNHLNSILTLTQTAFEQDNGQPQPLSPQLLNNIIQSSRPMYDQYTDESIALFQSIVSPLPILQQLEHIYEQLSFDSICAYPLKVDQRNGSVIEHCHISRRCCINHLGWDSNALWTSHLLTRNYTYRLHSINHIIQDLTIQINNASQVEILTYRSLMNTFRDNDIAKLHIFATQYQHQQQKILNDRLQSQHLTMDRSRAGLVSSPSLSLTQLLDVNIPEIVHEATTTSLLLPSLDDQLKYLIKQLIIREDIPGADFNTFTPAVSYSFYLQIIQDTLKKSQFDIRRVIHEHLTLPEAYGLLVVITIKLLITLYSVIPTTHKVWLEYVPDSILSDDYDAHKMSSFAASVQKRKQLLQQSGQPVTPVPVHSQLSTLLGDDVELIPYDHMLSLPSLQQRQNFLERRQQLFAGVVQQLKYIQNYHALHGIELNNHDMPELTWESMFNCAHQLFDTAKMYFDLAMLQEHFQQMYVKIVDNHILSDAKAQATAMFNQINSNNTMSTTSEMVATATTDGNATVTDITTDTQHVEQHQQQQEQQQVLDLSNLTPEQQQQLEQQQQQNMFNNDLTTAYSNHITFINLLQGQIPPELAQSYTPPQTEEEWQQLQGAAEEAHHNFLNILAHSPDNDVIQLASQLNQDQANDLINLRNTLTQQQQEQLQSEMDGQQLHQQEQQQTLFLTMPDNDQNCGCNKELLPQINQLLVEFSLSPLENVQANYQGLSPRLQEYFTGGDVCSHHQLEINNGLEHILQTKMNEYDKHVHHQQQQMIAQDDQAMMQQTADHQQQYHYQQHPPQ